MEELATILDQFGVNALWGIVIYKLLDFVEAVGILIIIYFGFKKALPWIKKFVL